jgi:ATP-dependent Clp protease ATP-binding subunit ClpA
LAAAGFDPAYGARPLKRIINKELKDQLALEILNGQVKGGKEIVLDYEHDKIVFKEA